ncbi:bile acid:sodium symporter family protein [Halalkalibacter nanhaiisediminis]|uniref:BASS family bile acid:Na+ symporter n=1 Tax=Halalkalibacter nanhaiisediminis TaxID=688079 RepID=A0A562Q7G9_9BACI|nr:bile acid:sodium symporter [Halalkalibacter nanhaiisediminis]TWI52658.1 BASS family bile acid:Na+ symporter [Halalkalibacter nanhaiisediminis]
MTKTINTLNEFISKRLSIFIICAAVFTYLSPIYLKVESWLPSLLLGVVIFFTGLSMNVEAIKDIRIKQKELVLATLLKWTLTVLISLGLAFALFSEHTELAAGLILSGTVPSATAATLYTFLAGGNTSLVIAASLLDIAISPVVTPLAMLGFSNEISISFLKLLQSFFMIVILPISLGVLVQKTIPKVVTHSLSITKFGSSMALLLIIHTIVGSGKEAITSQIAMLPIVFIATFIQVVLPMALAYVIARRLKIGEKDARGILFHAGLCNTALAAILAFEFIGELAVIPPIINMVINLSVGSFLANYFSGK